MCRQAKQRKLKETRQKCRPSSTLPASSPSSSSSSARRPSSGRSGRASTTAGGCVLHKIWIWCASVACMLSSNVLFSTHNIVCRLFLRINTIYVCHVMSCAVFHSADIRARIQGAIRFQRLHVEIKSDRGAAQPVRRRVLRCHGGPSALLSVILYYQRSWLESSYYIDYVLTLPLQPLCYICYDLMLLWRVTFSVLLQSHFRATEGADPHRQCPVRHRLCQKPARVIHQGPYVGQRIPGVGR